MIYFAVDLFDQVRQATTSGKVALDFPVPSFLCQIFEPSGKLLTFRLREMNNGVFDGVQSHALTIA